MVYNNFRKKMTTISEIEKMKSQNLRCYYVDSDGDEVIVSDDEDYETAIEYFKSKEDSDIKFSLCKRQDGDSEGGDEIFKQEPELEHEGSFKNVEETTSCNGIDEDEAPKISNVSETGAEEFKHEMISKTEEESKISQNLDSQLKDAVNETGAVQFPSELNNVFNITESEADGLQEAMSSEVDTESQNIPMSKRESELSGVKDSLAEDFDIIKSKINSFAPQAQEK